MCITVESYHIPNAWLLMVFYNRPLILQCTYQTVLVEFQSMCLHNLISHYCSFTGYCTILIFVCIENFIVYCNVLITILLLHILFIFFTFGFTLSLYIHTKWHLNSFCFTPVAMSYCIISACIVGICNIYCVQ